MPTVSYPALPDLDSNRVRETAVATAFDIADRWSLSRADLATILGVSTSTLDNWRRRTPTSVPMEKLEKISYLMHIHRSLMQIVGREGLHKWLASANTASPFLGARPLDFLLRGQVGNLLDTHRYLKRFASGSF